MPGKLVKVLVKPGQTVNLGQPMVVMEAMKMEHSIVAPCGGVVMGGEGLHVGGQVEDGQVLLHVVSEEEYNKVMEESAKMAAAAGAA